MAYLPVYKCKDCGYAVAASDCGFYLIESGINYHFRCSTCMSIVTLSSDYLVVKGYYPRCPECHSDSLSTWNPDDGRCPRCEGEMEIDLTRKFVHIK